MSERWKYQIKTGLLWSLFMTLFISVTNEKTFSEQIYSNDLYVRFGINLLVGVFVFGYFMWKGQDPKYNSWKTIFKKNKD